MKRRLCSLFMAAAVALSCVSFVYADDAAVTGEGGSSAVVEEQTEAVTEAPTEAPTEAATEAPTEAATKAVEVVTEATTSAAVTTTKSSKKTTEKAYEISIKVDKNVSINSYLDDGLTASDMTWTNSNDNIVTITKTGSGRFNAKKKGSCVITAKYETDASYYYYSFDIKLGEGVSLY